jgi:hypothetical protein
MDRLNPANIVRAAALTGGALFFLVHGGRSSLAAVDAPGEKPPRELATLEGLEVRGLAQDGAFVYLAVWTNSEKATIYKIPKAGGAKTAIYSGPDLPGVMVARPSGVYFTRATAEGGIMVVPLAGGASKRLDRGDATPNLEVRPVGGDKPALLFHAPYDNMVVDGDQIFVSSSYVNVVAVLPRAGGKLKVLANPRSGVTGLAANGTALYYATEDGEIRHLAKNGKAGGLDMSGRARPHDLIALDGGLAWAEGGLTGPGGCFLASRSAKGPKPVPLPGSWEGVRSPTKSGDSLWFIFADQYRIDHLAKAPLAGGPAVEQPGPFGVDFVVGDGDAVYFIAVAKDGKSKYVGAIGR